MNQWQLADFINMGCGNRQEPQIVRLLLSIDEFWEGSLERDLANVRLDLNFPKTGNTQNQLVLGIFTQGKRTVRQFFRRTVSPDEGMGIDQKLHLPSAQNPSGNSASKSSVVDIAPVWSPATRCDTGSS